ncbi:polyphosphate--glucose phosphotransferase [Galactobacter valiniphilus]|uniref:ROK family protein n=1 Tax=Galactobacter valiniphilus TaxID=2676122 RepID=A0A399JBM7_9MICC|nr:ROK family protein [Galactobacter valiniphilus]RII42975.1 ROK family protein [Galactobacter valiniphilus]
MAQQAHRFGIGIDIGGTGIKGGIVDLKKGKLVGERFRIPTPQPATPEAVAAVVAEVVAELDSREDAPALDSPVGVTFPSIVVDGVTLSAANVDKSWIGTNADALFTRVLGRPVHLMNDADAAGLAEARFGAGKDTPGVVLTITLGTGIGSAMVNDGRLVPNTELGHLEMNGTDAESQASASARERLELDWDQYAQRLQQYFSHVEFLFSPRLFIVGGGISKRSEDFLPQLKLKTPIIPAKLKNNAGIVGAALQAGVQEKAAAKAAKHDAAEEPAEA